MSRDLLVFGEKTFKITIPDDAKVTFAPFSPPTRGDHGWAGSGKAAGTVRIYRGTKDNIMAVFSGVTGFRDTSLEYMEEVVREEGATIWKSDEKGYVRDEKRSGSRTWVQPALVAGDDPPPVEDILP